ncbi:MAG: hypothetical protein EOP42_07630 [Sphingobacteriaceae bacterium]|nr:MAG: hypothetical protein EOP42_07630 [Sphingobacteriaceae bacterium]
MLYFQKITLGFVLVCCLSACNEPIKKVNKLRNYQIKVLPDSIVFGQNKAVVLSIKNLKATDVINLPENDTSIEITYNLEVTNNHPINGEYVFVNLSNFRLVLDNHHKLTHAFYNSLGADPQSTTTSVGNIFNLPAKTKPVALELFFADSVASMKVLLQ